jgi:hypothetical protein
MHPIFKISSKISPIFRRRRAQRFLHTFALTPETRILDVGGLPQFWAEMPVRSRITLLNLTPPDEFHLSCMTPNMEWVVGDGTRLDYDDGSFDLAFSNSVIEHLGTWERQLAFAREVTRVGRTHWVQSPAREFVLEPHYCSPFIHWFSKPMQRRLLRNFTLWGWLQRPGPDVIDECLAELRLLSRAEFRMLFPESDLWTERLAGLPKSYTAFNPIPARVNTVNRSTRPATARAA